MLILMQEKYIAIGHKQPHVDQACTGIQSLTIKSNQIDLN